MEHTIVVFPAVSSADAAGVRVSGSEYPSIEPRFGGHGFSTDAGVVNACIQRDSTDKGSM